MSRVKIGLNKTSQQRVKRFAKQITANPIIDDKTTFITNLENALAEEINAQKHCSERAVTDYFFNVLETKLDDVSSIEDNFFTAVIAEERKKLSSHYTNKTFDNNVDRYFNDVKREYILHPQNESNNLEFTEGNYDIFIKNNLKLVISVAKKIYHTNKSLPFEDLIQLGNEGLLTAIDKFDANRGNLKIAIKKLINSSELDTFTATEAEEIIRKGFTYDDNLKSTLKHLPADGFSNKEDFLEWVNKHVQTAVFASVAFMWIRANIVNELERIGTIIRVPKKTKKEEDNIDYIDVNLYPELAEALNDANKNDLNMISLDSINPYTDDCYHDNELADVTQEQFIVEDEAIDDVERKETFKRLVECVLNNLQPTERRIIKKRFGIGIPYELSINEIAESENMNVNKVKYAISSSLASIANSFNALDKETILQML